MVLVMVPVMVRFWSVLPERRPVHLLEEPEDGAELGGGAVGAFSELVGVRRRRLAELQGDFFHQCRIAVFSIKPTFPPQKSSPLRDLLSFKTDVVSHRGL